MHECFTWGSYLTKMNIHVTYICLTGLQKHTQKPSVIWLCNIILNVVKTAFSTNLANFFWLTNAAIGRPLKIYVFAPISMSVNIFSNQSWRFRFTIIWCAEIYIAGYSTLTMVFILWISQTHAIASCIRAGFVTSRKLCKFEFGS